VNCGNLDQIFDDFVLSRLAKSKWRRGAVCIPIRARVLTAVVTGAFVVVLGLEGLDFILYEDIEFLPILGQLCADIEIHFPSI